MEYKSKRKIFENTVGPIWTKTCLKIMRINFIQGNRGCHFESSFTECIIVSILENGNEERIENVKVFYGAVTKR